MTPVATLGPKQFTALLASIMALGALGIDLMLPVFDEIRLYFGLVENDTSVAQIVTVYFLGMASGQIFYGPFTDRFGRKPVLYVGLAIYALGALGAALAPNLPLVLASRFVWGVGAAGGRVVAVAVIRDVYQGVEMARAMSFIMAVFITVPILAPSLGAAIAALGPWQIVFWFSAVYGIAVAAWSLRLNETLTEADRRPLRIQPVVAAIRQVVTTPQSIGYALAMTFLFGAFSSYLASSELIVGEIYDRQALFPFVFGGAAAVMGSAMLANARLVGRLGVNRTVHVAITGYTTLAGVLLVVTLSTGGKPPFWLAITGITIVLVMHATMIPNVNTIALQPLGHIAGMASAAIGTISLAGGAILGSILDRSLGATITPLVVGFVTYGLIAAGFVTWAERAGRQAPQHEPAPTG